MIFCGHQIAIKITTDNARRRVDRDLDKNLDCHHLDHKCKQGSVYVWICCSFSSSSSPAATRPSASSMRLVCSDTSCLTSATFPSTMVMALVTSARLQCCLALVQTQSGATLALLAHLLRQPSCWCPHVQVLRPSLRCEQLIYELG